MIDTDKYEGHSEGEWKVGARKGAMTVRDSNGEEIAATNSYPIARLIADAPLLLAEVKRMNRFAHCAMNFMSKHDLHFQFLNEHGVYTATDGGSISMFIPYSYKWDDETKVSSESIQFTIRGEEE